VINDVTGFSDPAMLKLALETDCGLIAMRSRLSGGALAMPDYGSHGETTPKRAFEELARIRDRILSAGIAPERLLLDPGFGFGTTFTEDAAIWQALPELPRALDWPVERFCIGISRKRFLAWRAGNPALRPVQRDSLTAEAHRESAQWGYRIFRTHSLHAS
jgi:dihydropteroate synthase